MVYTRHEYEHLFSIYVPIAAGVFGIVVVLVLFALLRFSRRAPERAAKWHENNPLEGGYAVLLTCVVAFLLYLTFTAEHRVDTVANTQHPALTMNVTGAKWEWQFEYAGYGFSVRSGTEGQQPVVLPVGVPIRFNLRTDDVIHAFWVPELRYKHDLIPGSTQVATLAFDRPGRFPGQCAEFCGLRHSDMVFTIYAVTPAQFATWAKGKGASPVP